MGRAEPNFITEPDVQELTRSTERRADTLAEAVKHLFMTKIDTGAAIRKLIIGGGSPIMNCSVR